MTASTPNLPDLPLINLGNADITATSTAFAGQNAIIGEYVVSCTLNASNNDVIS